MSLSAKHLINRAFGKEKEDLIVRLEKRIDLLLQEIMWSDEEAQTLKREIVEMWERLSVSEYPVFALAQGKNSRLYCSLGHFVSRGISLPNERLFNELFDNGWLCWNFPLGELTLLDLRTNCSKEIPERLSLQEIDIEFYLIGDSEEAEEFCDLEVHGLGERKYQHREKTALPNSIIVIMDPSLPPEWRQRVSEAANERQWRHVTYDLTASRRPQLFEELALHIPGRKQSAFARMTGIEALRLAQAHDVVRFSVLLISSVAAFTPAITLIPLITAIHSYVILRVAWLAGRDVDLSLLPESLGVVGGAMSLGYGARAVIGTASSGFPLIGKFISGYLLGTITEELGESAINHYFSLTST